MATRNRTESLRGLMYGLFPAIGILVVIVWIIRIVIEALKK